MTDQLTRATDLSRHNRKTDRAEIIYGIVDGLRRIVGVRHPGEPWQVWDGSCWIPAGRDVAHDFGRAPYRGDVEG